MKFSERNKRIFVNTLMVIVLTAIFGLQELPVLLAVVFGMLFLEWLLFRFLDWYWGGLDD